MIIVKVPLRIPFFSGASDIPAFYEVYGGAALSVTIDKYVYVIVNNNDSELLTFNFHGDYEEIELEHMKHDITRESLKEYKIDGSGLLIISSGNIVKRGTGLGSSSAYAVGLLKILDWWHSFCQNEIEPRKLAELACKIELEKCMFPIGKQDAYAAAIGGFNLYEFNRSGSVDIKQLDISSETIKQLKRELVLINLNVLRHSSDILNYHQKTVFYSPEKIEQVKVGRDLAFECWNELTKGRIDYIGNLFKQSWKLKKSINKITTNEYIDHIINRFAAIEIYGKVLGAGGGGFALFYVKDRWDNVEYESIMKDLNLKETPFRFVNEGAKFILKE